MDIRQLLSRRTDLSTFVVHLTRSGDGETGHDRLVSILASGRIEARTPYGQALSRIGDDAEGRESQKVVCFTETPLEHLHLLVQPIENRQFEFSKYGLAFTKKVSRQSGANPIWYIDITPGHDWLTVPLNRLVETAIAAGNFAASDLAKITPFIEQMGTHPEGNYRKEFWWEREWRCGGNFQLTNRFIGLCPEDDINEFSGLSTDLGYHAVWLDPIWGLEEIIGRLAGFQENEIRV